MPKGGHVMALSFEQMEDTRQGSFTPIVFSISYHEVLAVFVERIVGEMHVDLT